MKLSTACVDLLITAEAKALATYSSESGVNVVPVSSLRIKDDQIILVNYFFNQTLKNIESNGEVSLVAWKGLVGYQIKANAKHETSGPIFAEVVEWIKETIPGREVKGVLILTPKKYFNISAGSDAGKEIAS